MKVSLLLSLLLLGTSALHANPEIATVVSQEYGAATSDGIVLLISAASAGEPDQWAVYARDPFRPGELVRAQIKLTNNAWAPTADGAGAELLRKVPPQPLAFSRLRLRSADARRIALQNAVLAKANFVTVQYQLAANAATSAPEWALTLYDTAGVESGFVVISAETGAVLHQQWGANAMVDSSATPPPVTKGEKAADEVKRSAREAWQWTGENGKEVGRFFKRLFKN